MDRRYEIDWIRNISILMLFVYHTDKISASGTHVSWETFDEYVSDAYISSCRMA